MTITNDNLQFRERSATLPYFANSTRGTHLARKHISIPDDVMAEITELCRLRHTRVSKFILGGIRMALDDARLHHGTEAANDVLPDRERDPPRPPAPRAALALVSSDPPPPVATLQRHDTTWFDLVPLCDLLRVSPTALLAQIDEEDDLLEHEDRPWLDVAGAHALLELCPDSVRRGPTATWLASQL